MAVSSRRLAVSESSPLATVFVGKLRQIKRGVLRPAIEVVPHSRKHISLGVMDAGSNKLWRNSMTKIILDLLIELQMSVIMMTASLLIIGHVDSGRGFMQGLMRMKERQQDTSY